MVANSRVDTSFISHFRLTEGELILWGLAGLWKLLLWCLWWKPQVWGGKEEEPETYRQISIQGREFSQHHKMSDMKWNESSQQE